MSTAGLIAQAYLLSAPANASKTVTVTFNKTIAAAALWIDDFNPNGGIVAVNSATTFASGSGTAINLPSIAVTSSGDLLASVASTSNAITGANSPWTANAGGIQAGNLAAWDASASTTTAVNFTALSGSWNALGMSFKDSPPHNVAVAGKVTLSGKTQLK
jgi:hypothetical protein